MERELWEHDRRKKRVEIICRGLRGGTRPRQLADTFTAVRDARSPSLDSTQGAVTTEARKCLSVLVHGENLTEVCPHRQFDVVDVPNEESPSFNAQALYAPLRLVISERFQER